LFAALWLAFEAVISWAAFCQHQHEYNSANQTIESFECAFRGPVASVAGWIAGWWVRIFDKADDYIALFTLVLSLGTLALWWSTRRLWNVTRIEAEHIPRVERAYVSGGATGVEGSPQHFAVTVDNYGKNPRIHWYYLGKHCPRKRIARYPRLRSAGIWLVRRPNVEARHIRSSSSHSSVGCDRGPRDLWSNLVSRHFQAMPFGGLHLAHPWPWPNYRCRKSRCILGGSPRARSWPSG